MMESAKSLTGNKVSVLSVWSISVALVTIGCLTVSAQAPFGTEAQQAYGEELWSVLTAQGFAGDGAIMAKPYEGTDPHGMILITLAGEATVNGDRGKLIVKRNHGGPGASVDSVASNPSQTLNSITVMFQRDGFAPENNNWFWAKYLPDGSYDTAPNGAALVGSPTGCISCHDNAPGGDMVFLNDGY